LQLETQLTVVVCLENSVDAVVDDGANSHGWMDGVFITYVRKVASRWRMATGEAQQKQRKEKEELAAKRSRAGAVEWCVVSYVEADLVRLSLTHVRAGLAQQQRVAKVVKA
jgi:hypothetical protein